MVDGTIQGIEALHARAGGADQQDISLALVEVPQEVKPSLRQEQVEAADHVEVRSSCVASLDQQLRGVSGAAAKLSDVVETIVLGRALSHKRFEVRELHGRAAG